MEHNELVQEMVQIDRLSTQERLKLAKKRRVAQLKRHAVYEKSVNAKGPPSRHQRIDFSSNVKLLEAASRNEYDEVKRLLDNGVDPNSANQDGLSALHQCCIDNCDTIIRLLLAYGADVNCKDAELWTPLHAAATCGHLNLCKLLIDSGADLLAVNADGNMAYDVCEDETTLDFVEGEMDRRGITQDLIDDLRVEPERRMLRDLQTIVAHDISHLEFRDKQGATPLHIAAANNYINVARFLLQNVVSVNPRDDDGWTPLHAAACWANPEIVELLAAASADLEAVNKWGETPFDVCDDADLKQRLLALREERAHSDVPQRRGRPNNSSFRGSIVRRTSMREKRATQHKERKEAQEEATKIFYGTGDGGDTDPQSLAPGGIFIDVDEQRNGVQPPADRSQRSAADVGREIGITQQPTRSMRKKMRSCCIIQ